MGCSDEIIHPLAKDLVNHKPGIPFIKFRSEVANLSGSRLKRTLTKVTTNVVEEDEEIERPNKKKQTGLAVLGCPNKNPVGTKQVSISKSG